MPRLKNSIPEATVFGPYSESEAKFASDNCNSMSIADIATALGRTYGSVQQHLLRRGVVRKVVKRNNLRPFLVVDEPTLAYLAGLVDGEGTISINHGDEGYGPYLCISNTSDALAEWCRSKGFSVGYSRTTNCRPYWRMSLYGMRIREVLLKLLPYLVVKKQQAELLIEFIDLRLSQTFREKPSERMLTIFSKIRRLNRRIPVSSWSKQGPSSTTSQPPAAPSSPTDSLSTTAT